MKAQWHGERILYRGKERERGLILWKYDNLYELGQRRNPAYAWSLDQGEFVSQVTTKKKGIVYIPLNQLKLDDIYFIRVDGEFVKFLFYDIGDHGAGFRVFVSDEKEFKHEMSRSRSKKAA